MKKAVLINDTTYDFHHGCEAVVSAIKNNLFERGVEVVATCPVGVHFKKHPRLLSEIKSADLVVINGEGTIHHGREKAGWLLEVSDYTRSIGVPCALINMTYQENPTEFNERLKNNFLICVRESESQKEVASVGLTAEIVPDLTFILSKKYSELCFDRNGIGITDSAFSDVSKDNLMSAIENSYLFLPVLRSYRNEGQFSVKEKLRHLKFLFANNFIKEDFNVLSEEQFLKVRNKYIKTTLKSYMDSISGLELLLTSRFHSLCFSIVTETPFLAMNSNSHKVESLLKDIGLEHRLVDRCFFKNKISSGEFFFSDDEIDRIKEYKRNSVCVIDDMFDRLSSI